MAEARRYRNPVSSIQRWLRGAGVAVPAINSLRGPTPGWVTFGFGNSTRMGGRVPLPRRPYPLTAVLDRDTPSSGEAPEPRRCSESRDSQQLARKGRGAPLQDRARGRRLEAWQPPDGCDGVRSTLRAGLAQNVTSSAPHRPTAAPTTNGATPTSGVLRGLTTLSLMRTSSAVQA